MWPICHHLGLLKICIVDLCDLSIYQLVAKSYQSFQRPMRGEGTFFIPAEFLFVAVNNLSFWVCFFERVLFCFLVCKLLYFCFLLWMMKCVLQERSASSILVLFMYAYLLGRKSRNKPVQAAALRNYRCDSCIWQYMMVCCGLSKELAVSFSHAQVEERPLYQSSTSESFWHQQVMEVLPLTKVLGNLVCKDLQFKY